ncbi:molybdopterin converting factor small subunit/gas vesicle protein [Caldalkalibacillus uzonensis]|uniref:Molybdopterin converting factor small subunit/gas vesicle protein n=1 Tax=Caldalkalibacillus uzonensis TaxID=353224 RepID=A0ABU0CPM7_9BACI|nr:hypothetical protein [Caldalkalibacillus uzonensis]MDQ0337455.1 molybdopterin converting factor small subunit/gas vesicle protein [Caldalkalibacillus uzonensis]
MFTRREDELYRLLSPIRKRLIYRLIWNISWRVIPVALGLGCGILVLSRVIPLTQAKLFLWLVVLLSAAAVFMATWTQRPTYRQAAREADQRGLNESVMTAWQYGADPSPIARQQKKDAIEQLRHHLPAILKQMPVLKVAGTRLIVSGSLLATLMLLMVLPNPMDDVLYERQITQEATDEATQKLEEAKQDIKQSGQLTAEQQEDLIQKLEDLQQQLQERQSLSENINNIEQASTELAALADRERLRQDALQHMYQAVQQAAANAQPVDMDVLQGALSAEQLELLAEELKALQNRLEALAAEGQQANQNAVTDLLQQQLSHSGQFAAQAAQLASQLSEAQTVLAQAQQLLAGEVTSSGTWAANPSQPASQQGGSSASPPSSTSGQPGSGSAGSGHAEQQGQGNSQGEGQSGSTGEGTAQGSGTQGSGGGAGGGGTGGSGSGPGGSGAGLGAGSRQLVSVPSERIAGQGDHQATIGGPTGEGENGERLTRQSYGASGTVTPYREVYQQYEHYVREQLQSGHIPPAYEDVVKRYFSQIEP